ncbi:MAG: hypothetical protein COB90_02290 [Hyphomicrobiales bacterium]|nr:MAG: hypothetical protein COB90_02290 [Hyphomicrobiales bacterium]
MRQAISVEKLADNGQFSISGWDEEDVHTLPEPFKFKRANVERVHKGVLCGTERMQYVLIYKDTGRSEFQGIGVFEGMISGLQGRFAMIESGSFADGQVKTRFEVRHLSQIHDLSTVIGTGHYVTGAQEQVSYRYTATCPDQTCAGE